MTQKQVEKYLEQYVVVNYQLGYDDDEIRVGKGILHKGYTPPACRSSHINLEMEANGYWVEEPRATHRHFMWYSVLKIRKMTEEEIKEWDELHLDWIKPNRRKK